MCKLPTGDVLTKSSPESAPTEVMDSLLMVRGMRTPLRGAVAASSAIFFFNLANMSVLSVSLFWAKSAVSVEWATSRTMHGVYGSLFWGPKQSRVLMQCHSKQVGAADSILLHLEKEKRQLLKCQHWQQRLLVCNSHVSHCCNEPNKIKTHSFWHPLSSYNRQAILTYQWQTDASKSWMWLFSLSTLQATSGKESGYNLDVVHLWIKDISLVKPICHCGFRDKIFPTIVQYFVTSVTLL